MRTKSKLFSPEMEKTAFFAGSFLFFAFVMWCAPYSSDDIEFSRLSYTSLSGYVDFALRYGNGRLLGNLLAILLCHSRLLCVVVKAGILASCVMMLPRLLGCAHGLGYAMSFVLFTLIEPAVFGEVYVWTSGFSNYLPPIWLTLVILCILYRDGPPNVLHSILVLLFGLCSQLFIEHSSSVNLLLALACAWGAWRKKHTTRWISLCWVLGTLVGLALMLLIPRLFYTAGNRVETYRSLNLGSLLGLVYSVARNGIQLCGHYFGACLLPVCLGALACSWQTRNSWSSKALHRLYGLSIGSLGYLLLSMALDTITYRGKSALVEHCIECCMVTLPLIAWAVAACKLDKPLRRRVLGCLAFALISLAPLLLVTPIPTRVVYQSYVFVLMGAMLSCYPVLSGLSERGLRWVKKGLVATSLALALIIGSVFSCVHSMIQLRDEHIRRCIEQGDTTIAIFSLPYSYTSWDHLWSQSMQYGDLTDAQLTFESVSFDTWMHQYYSLGR